MKYELKVLEMKQKLPFIFEILCILEMLRRYSQPVTIIFY